MITVITLLALIKFLLEPFVHSKLRSAFGTTDWAKIKEILLENASFGPFMLTWMDISAQCW